MFSFATFFQNCFPYCTHQIGNDAIKQAGQNNRRSGKLIPFLDQEQIEHTKNDDVYHVFNCFSAFCQITALQNVLEGIIKEHDHHLDQREYDGFVSVNGIFIRIQTVMSQKIAHNKSKLKTDHVKNHEIQMLQPSCG